MSTQSKKAKLVQAPAVTSMAIALIDAAKSITIQNAQDLGYQFALYDGGKARFVEYCDAHGIDLTKADSIPEATVAAFKAGVMIRFAETHPAKKYTREGDQLAPCADGAFEVSVGFAVGMPRHEYGTLKGDVRQVVQSLREAAKGYADTCWQRLLSANTAEKRAAKHEAAINGQKVEAGNTRKTNKLFGDWLNGVLVDAIAKNKRAKEAGDNSHVDDAKLRVSIETFKNSLKA